MIIRILVLLLPLFTLVELCVPTIPPEEVFITSTGANLPTDEPETEEPPTDAPVTNTPTDMCTECDINDITPVLAEPGATKFTSTETAATGECKKTTVMCQRTDNKVCDSVTMSAQSASGITSIGTSSTVNSVTSQLTCAADGTYSFNTVTGITKLSCDFVNCKEPVPCATCDVNTIAPPMPLPAGQSFEAPEVTGPDGCKQATVKCSRTDGQICTSISIGSQGATGSATLNNAPNSNEVEATVTCQNDGTYSLGTTTGITSLTCNFDTCDVPSSCETCMIGSVMAPTTGPGEAFTTTEGTAADGCKQVTVKCARTDNKVCNSISIGSQGAGGSQELISFTNANEAETILLCQPDGTYTSGLALITALSCDFDMCEVPPSCINNCALTPTAVTTSNGRVRVSIIEGMGTNGCKIITLTCAWERQTVECVTADILAQTSTGSVIVSTDRPTSTSSTAELKCAADGTFISNGFSGLSQFYCDFDCF